MKKFKCVLVRSQYQTLELEAEDFTQAKKNARFLFNQNKDYEQYIEVYECTEIEETE